MKRYVVCSALLLLMVSAHAKLPAPPPADPDKAAEAAAKTAWSGKVDAYKLCMAQNRAVADYHQTAAAAGKTLQSAAASAPTCADPGPFAYVAPAAKPAEAAGAHSPAATAVSPPSSQAPAGPATPAK